MGTDPDADRLGIGVPDGEGFRLITGNQLGALLADYIFSSRKEMGTLPEKFCFIKTIVTSELQRRIAESCGAVCVDVLTGFKYIGEKILEFEKKPNGPEFIFGGEESYGYLVHTKARDKDAVSAATMTAEMTLYHVSQGRSLMDQLRFLWEKYGYFKETLISNYFKGQSGGETMKRMMEKFRTAPPLKLAGMQVQRVRDYQASSIVDPVTRSLRGALDFPKSNVIQFVLDAALITVRPSGTEPKIKFYASCWSEPGETLAKAQAAVEERTNELKAEIQKLLEGA
jgi:phosphoglucomutase